MLLSMKCLACSSPKQIEITLSQICAVVASPCNRFNNAKTPKKKIIPIWSSQIIIQVLPTLECFQLLFDLKASDIPLSLVTMLACMLWASVLACKLWASVLACELWALTMACVLWALTLA